MQFTGKPTAEFLRRKNELANRLLQSEIFKYMRSKSPAEKRLDDLEMQERKIDTKHTLHWLNQKRREYLHRIQNLFDQNILPEPPSAPIGEIPTLQEQIYNKFCRPLTDAEVIQYFGPPPLRNRVIRRLHPWDVYPSTTIPEHIMRPFLHQAELQLLNQHNYLR